MFILSMKDLWDYERNLVKHLFNLHKRLILRMELWGVELDPHREGLPILGKSHIFERKEATIGFQQPLNVGLKLVAGAYDIENIGNTR